MDKYAADQMMMKEFDKALDALIPFANVLPPGVKIGLAAARGYWGWDVDSWYDFEKWNTPFTAIPSSAFPVKIVESWDPTFDRESVTATPFLRFGTAVPTPPVESAVPDARQ